MSESEVSNIEKSWLDILSGRSLNYKQKNETGKQVGFWPVIELQIFSERQWTHCFIQKQNFELFVMSHHLMSVGDDWTVVWIVTSRGKRGAPAARRHCITKGEWDKLHMLIASESSPLWCGRLYCCSAECDVDERSRCLDFKRRCLSQRQRNVEVRDGLPVAAVAHVDPPAGILTDNCWWREPPGSPFPLTWKETSVRTSEYSRDKDYFTRNLGYRLWRVEKIGFKSKEEGGDACQIWIKCVSRAGVRVPEVV